MENNNPQPTNKEPVEETNKENHYLPAIKRNCTNRHSLQNRNHSKLEHKSSLNRFAKPTLSTLSNSISSIPVFECLNQNEKLTGTSSDGAMTKRVKDLSLIRTDNRLSPTIRPTYLTNDFYTNCSNFQNFQKKHSFSNASSNYEQKSSTAIKRRASMVDNSGVSPTKSKFIFVFCKF